MVQDAVYREMEDEFQEHCREVFQGDCRVVAAHITQQLHFSYSFVIS